MRFSISYNEGGNTALRESFYHGLMVGMLQTNPQWSVQSNREAGNGRADIVVIPRNRRKENYALILELKYSEEKGLLLPKAQEALRQINEKNFDDFFGTTKPDRIIHYGIAFHKKECCVLKEEVN